MKNGSNGNGLTTTLPIKNKAGQVVGHKEVVTYRGLLARAHEDHLVSIETSLLQYPSETNNQTAVVLAKAATSKGSFTGLGDASPSNVNPMIVPHLIRMAETRAKARALRDAVNIGVVCLEELGAELGGEGLYEGDMTAAGEPTPPDKSNGTGNGNGNGANGGNGEAQASPGTGNGNAAAHAFGLDMPMTDSQRKYLFRLLAAKGILGEAAKTWLLQRFNVEALKDVPKNAASDLIDQLISENGHGPAAEVSHAHSA
ncbi:MAG: hypothetical protein UT86_C0001G0241 [Candidatus Magasanikbacteria bacterium GW2011_GWC2_40_17]|uniref:Uncharacterized protein n=1 Tax=Candidatus Magasanikbacteria bacterium GW2011_GWA2_42_32 TaxID=1619039 RepID=A0A0G1CGC4_9BACT|nr:MAG: hypothetical protein UT86_C0001G0241 [Candidatus Magasanikbacteria bacterium GW2011_GWC2_40_17]KKS57601.1 MAG: hypothetical protein UV20_C0001G0241 [Candidatus Magasanikbacteria bacterium GW2011_GWA2_42_32]